MFVLCCTHTHTHTHTCTCTHACTCVHTHTHTYMVYTGCILYTVCIPCIHVYTMCMYVSVFCMYTYLYTHTHTHTPMHACVVHTHTHTHTHVTLVHPPHTVYTHAHTRYFHRHDIFTHTHKWLDSQEIILFKIWPYIAKENSVSRVVFFNSLWLQSIGNFCHFLQVHCQRSSTNTIQVSLHLQLARSFSYLQWPVSNNTRSIWEGWTAA